VTAAGLVGELATVSAISGTTLTVGALTNSYSTNDLVFLIEQNPTGGTCNPASSTGTWVANTTYSQSLYPPSSFLWILGVTNNDGTQTVTVSNTTDENPKIQ
jgi:hypothetical protein